MAPGHLQMLPPVRPLEHQHSGQTVPHFLRVLVSQTAVESVDRMGIRYSLIVAMFGICTWKEIRPYFFHFAIISHKKGTKSFGAAWVAKVR